MKKLLFFILLLASSVLRAQDFSGLETIRLEAKEDYKVADPELNKALDYLLGTPLNKDDINRAQCLRFLLRWMTGTPDYMFTIAGHKALKGNDDLLGVYLACMTRYCLNNPASAKDEKKVKLNTFQLLLQYCENEANQVKMTRGLKKLSEANRKGELEKALEE